MIEHTERASDQNPTRNRHARKRSAAQRAADAAFIEAHAVRGRTQEEIAELLAEVRPYRISRSQVQADLDQIRRRWLSSADEAFATARAKALRTLDALERAAWDLVESPGDATGHGIARVLAVHDRRMKLLGLEAPTRQEISGPDAGPLVVRVDETRALDETAKAELFRRHMQRLAEDSAATNASN